MDTKKLRQKILDLAIHGKLVPQDPNDEPASVLLERIRAEKEKLIKEGKIKAPKKSKSAGDTSHYPKDVPFAVPEGWVWCSFPEVAELISGQDFPPEKYNTSAKGTPYIIGASNIEDGHLRINRWTEYPSVLSQKGDVLVVCKGAGVGKVAVNDIGTVHIARQIQAVRIQDEIVSSDFMRILIDWCVPSIVTQANGLIPGLKRELLLNVLLPIPPRNEQDLIVSTLCGAFDIIKGMEVEQFNLEVNIRKSKERVLELAISGKLVPQDSSEEPAIELLKRINPDFQPSDNLHYEDIPQSWTVCRLSDVCVDFIVPQRDKPKIFDGDIPWCRIEDIEGKYLNGSLSGRLVSKKTIQQMNMRICPVGTVICSCSASIGTQAIVTQPCCTNQTFIGLVPDDRFIYNEFLYYFLASQTEQFLDIGTGTTIKYISREKFEEYRIPLPPLVEQRRIVERIEYCFLLLKQIQSATSIC